MGLLDFKGMETRADFVVHKAKQSVTIEKIAPRTPALAKLMESQAIYTHSTWDCID